MGKPIETSHSGVFQVVQRDVSLRASGSTARAPFMMSSQDTDTPSTNDQDLIGKSKPKNWKIRPDPAINGYCNDPASMYYRELCPKDCKRRATRDLRQPCWDTEGT